MAHVRILDLDDSLAPQADLFARGGGVGTGPGLGRTDPPGLRVRDLRPIPEMAG